MRNRLSGGIRSPKLPLPTAFLVSFHTNSEATSFMFCLGTTVTEVYLATTTPIRHPHLPRTTPRPRGDGAGRLMGVRGSVLRALQRLGIYSRPQSVCLTLCPLRTNFLTPGSQPLPQRLPSQQRTQLRVKLETCCTYFSVRQQKKNVLKMPKAFSGSRRSHSPQLHVSRKRHEARLRPLSPQDGPGFQGLERVLLAQCRPRLFNSSWHVSCTRWKTVNTDPGAAQGRARGSSRSDKICLARILRAEEHGVLLI